MRIKSLTSEMFMVLYDRPTSSHSLSTDASPTNMVPQLRHISQFLGQIVLFHCLLRSSEKQYTFTTSLGASPEVFIQNSRLNSITTIYAKLAVQLKFLSTNLPSNKAQPNSTLTGTSKYCVTSLCYVQCISFDDKSIKTFPLE